MKPNIATVIVLLTIFCLPAAISQRQALFIKKDIVENGKRVARQTSADKMVQNILQWLQGVYTDNSRRIRQGSLREYLPPINTQKPRPFQMVTPSDQYGDDDNNVHAGYPPSGSITPRPPFVDGFPSINHEITGFTGYPRPPKPQPPFTQSTNGYTATVPTRPSYPSIGTTGHQPGFSTNGYPHGPSTAYPASSTVYPRPTTGYPTGGYPSSSSSGYPSPSSSYPTAGYPRPTTGYPTAGYPSPTTGYPTVSYPSPTNGYPTTGFPNPSTGYPTANYPSPTTGYPVTNYPGPTTGYPQTNYPTQYPYPSSSGSPTGRYPYPSTDYPTTTTPPFVITDSPFTSSYSNTSGQYPTSSPRPFTSALSSTNYPTQSPTYSQSPFETDSPTTGYSYGTASPSSPKPDENTIPSAGPRFGGNTDHYPTDSEHTTVIAPPDFDDEDLKHPPHIHAIDVECSKDMMTINIEFNRQFDGIIYSKGHYNNRNCRYVNEHSGKIKYTFTVSLNSCGTEFINAFDTQGKSYLENVLVLQNEAGIQEVWDTVRSVRCLWEGNLKKVLNVALSVDMLNQEIVTFSGDTAMARLDIQRGKGPFAPTANGLVKIGEVMTLVVSVTGDPGFDIQVKDCRAKDSSGKNSVALSDDHGCILKPKLFGAFQKTRNTGNTGASIIAYAFFNAFKFPDVMDLTLECNVDLCKTDCAICPDPNQSIEPRRRKRETNTHNVTSDNSMKIGKILRVILSEDLNEINSNTAIHLASSDGICMSAHGFVLSSALLVSLLTSSCLFSAYIWLQYQRLKIK